VGVSRRVVESIAYYVLELLGPFRLRAPSGRRVDISSKKGQALIAMLAVAGGGERTRSWLQDKLWGSRQAAQAQASLRNELSSLRSAFTETDGILLGSDHARVWIELAAVKVDARGVGEIAGPCGEFLEGLDIPGEDGFEDWLREERARVRDMSLRRSALEAEKPTVPPPAQAQPPVQFNKLPALAVLPFTNQTGDPDKDIFADGISEDMLDRLSRLRWLPIIARSSSFGFRGDDFDPKAIGEQLGVRYLLDGRLRAENGKMVLAASLTDTDTGHSVWSNKQVIDAAVPTMLDDFLTGLTLTLGSKIDQQEQSRALRTPQSDLNVRDLIWRGRWHLNRFTAQDSVLAKQCFEDALAQEPNSPEAIVQMANALLWDAWAMRSQDSAIRAVRQMAQKAIIADYDDARGHMMAGIAECFLRQPIRAKAFLERAIDLNPSLFFAHGYLGSAMYLNDEPMAALDALNFAVRLSPNDQHLFHVLGEMAMSHLMLGEPAIAIEYADKSVMRRPAYWFAHVAKVNAFVQLDDMRNARSAYEELTASNLKFDEFYLDWIPFCDPKWNALLKEGLNLAAHWND
jgi:TolB-like protein/tetratricopeptide (TPR) repeat protein